MAQSSPKRRAAASVRRAVKRKERDVSDLTLRRIVWDDGRPRREREDHSVRQGGRDVGHIYWSTGGARGPGYAWFISRTGFAATLDDAKAEWQAVRQ
jgi:hypothetical protein